MLRTRLTLRPGSPGTKKLLAEYGSRLVCVRHRYDPDLLLRWKTVEIIVEEKPWPPPARTPAPDPLDYVHIRFPHRERATRLAVRRLGGYWDPTTASWRITHAAARLLRLLHHIITPADPKTTTAANDSDVNTSKATQDADVQVNQRTRK